MKIGIFSSSSNAIDSIYIEEAIKFIRLISPKNPTIVNGGANVGLMEIILKEAKDAGLSTIGVIPEKLHKHNLSSEHADKLIVTNDMKERKSTIHSIADVFVGFPGGFGTLEEIIEVITLKQLDYHRKAIVILNTNGFFDDLFKQFERSFRENFTKPDFRSFYFIAHSAKEAVSYLETYNPGPTVNKWHQVPENKEA